MSPAGIGEALRLLPWRGLLGSILPDLEGPRQGPDGPPLLEYGFGMVESATIEDRFGDRWGSRFVITTLEDRAGGAIRYV